MTMFIHDSVYFWFLIYELSKMLIVFKNKKETRKINQNALLKYHAETYGGVLILLKLTLLQIFFIPTLQMQFREDQESATHDQIAALGLIKLLGSSTYILH